MQEVDFPIYLEYCQYGSPEPIWWEFNQTTGLSRIRYAVEGIEGITITIASIIVP